MNRLELGYLPILVLDGITREYAIVERATVRLSDNTQLEKILVIGTRNQENWHLVYSTDLAEKGPIIEEKLKSVPLDRIIGYNPNIH